MSGVRTKAVADILADEKKAQKMLRDQNYDRFDSVCTVEFWSRLSRILARELQKATRPGRGDG